MRRPFRAPPVPHSHEAATVRCRFRPATRGLSTSRCRHPQFPRRPLSAALVHGRALDRTRTCEARESAMYETHVTVVGQLATDVGQQPAGRRHGTSPTSASPARSAATTGRPAAGWTARAVRRRAVLAQARRQRERLPREGRPGGRHRPALHPQLRARGAAADGCDARGAERRRRPVPLHGRAQAQTGAPAGEPEARAATEHRTVAGPTSDGRSSRLVGAAPGGEG